MPEDKQELKEFIKDYFKSNLNFKLVSSAENSMSATDYTYLTLKVYLENELIQETNEIYLTQ